MYFRLHIDAIVHTASPFSAYEPKDEQVLIKPAREGTLRVLSHGYEAGIRKFVITSSTAAIAGATPTTRNKKAQNNIFFILRL